MFTGIIEDLGLVKDVLKDKENINLTIESRLVPELKIDQSIAHNGVCLTVIELSVDSYTVTAIKETLDKSNMALLKINNVINLERAMKLGDRLDGHIVQGHVDQVATCIDVKELKGSWLYTFKYDSSLENITIEKGSITVNGVSLTVVNSKKDSFSVAIIPYTFKHTNFYAIKKDTIVNLEFDVLGKYISKLQRLRS